MSNQAITPIIRGAFLHVLRPQKPMKPTDDPKYSVVMLFDKPEKQLKALKKAASYAVANSKHWNTGNNG